MTTSEGLWHTQSKYSIVCWGYLIPSLPGMKLSLYMQLFASAFTVISGPESKKTKTTSFFFNIVLHLLSIFEAIKWQHGPIKNNFLWTASDMRWRSVIKLGFTTWKITLPLKKHKLLQEKFREEIKMDEKTHLKRERMEKYYHCKLYHWRKCWETNIWSSVQSTALVTIDVRYKQHQHHWGQVEACLKHPQVLFDSSRPLNCPAIPDYYNHMYSFRLLCHMPII